MSGALLERDAEMAAVERVLDGAHRRRGGALLVEGPSGIGKSTLLAAAGDAARRAGLRVLHARGSDRERLVPFGVARQLLEPVVHAASVVERAALLAGSAGLAAPVLGVAAPAHVLPPADPLRAAQVGLTWLTANLAARGPLALIVDDVHRVDEPSAGWLDSVVRRLDHLAAALVLAASGGAAMPFDASHAVRVLQLPALGDAALRTLIAQELGEPPEAAFARACRAATAGNPLLAELLLRALREERVRPLAANAARVESLRSAGVERVVDGRLRDLPLAPRAVARAVAVLGTNAHMADAALLAALDPDDAAAAADVLRRADLLAPGPGLAFAHPIVERAVYAMLPGTDRSSLHRRAAVALDRRGEPPERVAAHLLHTEPTGRPWSAARLRAAAAASAARGDPASAVVLLRRGLAEGVPEQRPALLAELAAAEVTARDPAAPGHARAALAECRDPERRAGLTLLLGRALVLQGRVAEAAEALDAGAAEAPDTEAALRLRAELCSAARLEPRWVGRASELLAATPEPAGTTPAQRAMLACLAGEAVAGGAPAEEGARLARRALGDGRLLRDESAEAPVFLLACGALTWCERTAEARAALDAALADARARGSALGAAHALAWRAEAHLAEGALADAVADADAALALQRGADGLPLPLAASWLALARLEQAGTDAATAALAGLPEALPEAGPFAVALFARGRIRLAERRPDAAAADLLAAGRALARSGVSGPGLAAWRPAAAVALDAAGERGAALELAAHAEADARRFGAPAALATALRARARLTTGEPRLALLHEAAGALQGGSSRLEQARTLHDLGGALRRAGSPKAARDPLRRALDLATDCGAAVLAAAIRGELLAAGARPRRARTRGVEALTPAELRACRLAASGLTNREIAETLFLTVKTVESQLAAAYAKLSIASRRELAGALGETSG